MPKPSGKPSADVSTDKRTRSKTPKKKVRKSEPPVKFKSTKSEDDLPLTTHARAKSFHVAHEMTRGDAAAAKQ